MPFRVGAPEIALIILLVLIIFGAGKLPQIGAAIGKSIREFRKARSGDDEKDKENKDGNVSKSTEPESKEKPS